MSEIKKKYYEENPDARERASEISKKQWENTEAREKMSEIKKKYYEENPDARERASEISKKQWEKTEAKEKQSEAQKKRFENPEERKKNSEAQKKRFENPEERKKNREAQKNRSPEQKYQSKKKRADTLGENKQFVVFTIDGVFIKTFTYLFEAQEYLQKEYNIKSKINIGQVLSGSRNNSAGFIFKYK